MGVLSSKYPNVQAVEEALNKACESVNQTDFNAFRSNVYTKSETNDYTTAEKEKLAGIETGANKTVVDSALSHTSTNPVQNKAVNTALGTKANSSEVYTKTESDSRFLGINGTAVKAVADENGSNISETFSAVKNDIAINRTTLGTQCKNLFKNTAVSQTAYGVTFTVNDDKSIIVDGTATRNIYLNMGSFYFEAGKQYILTGCPSGGSETKYFLSYDGMAGDQYDTGSGTTFSVSESATKSMLLVIISGQTVSNLTFKPMLRDADIVNDTYEPYQPSLQEQIKDLEERISALEGGV